MIWLFAFCLPYPSFISISANRSNPRESTASHLLSHARRHACVCKWISMYAWERRQFPSQSPPLIDHQIQRSASYQVISVLRKGQGGHLTLHFWWEQEGFRVECAKEGVLKEIMGVEEGWVQGPALAFFPGPPFASSQLCLYCCLAFSFSLNSWWAGERTQSLTGNLPTAVGAAEAAARCPFFSRCSIRGPDVQALYIGSKDKTNPRVLDCKQGPWCSRLGLVQV